MFKKLIVTAALMLLATAAQAQYWYTNASASMASSNLVTTSRWVIAEIQLTGGASAAATVNFYDSKSTNATNVVSSYVSVTQSAYTNTTIFTNAQSLVITNYDIGTTFTSTTNAAATNLLPVIFSATVPPNTTLTRSVDIVTVRGLAFSTDTNVSVNIKYRPWSTGVNP